MHLYHDMFRTQHNLISLQKLSSLVPKPSTPPVLIACSILQAIKNILQAIKTGGVEGLGTRLEIPDLTSLSGKHSFNDSMGLGRSPLCYA